MYNLTLESIDGNKVFTFKPACFGFMKRGAADYNIRAHQGWATQGDGNYTHNEPVNRLIPFNELKYIWLTGTHVDSIRTLENPDYDRNIPISSTNQRLISRYGEEEMRNTRFGYHNGYMTSDYVLNAMREMHITIPEGWDYIEELKTIEAYFDAGRESIIRRHPWNNQIFGVQVNENIPADRALNYLMLSRAFTTEDQSTKAYVYLRYVKGLTPAQAAILHRMVYCTTNWGGTPQLRVSPNYGDGAIYPGYMIARGVGALYAEPKAVNWVQPCYSDMNRLVNNVRVSPGHLRDSLMPTTIVYSLYSQTNRQCYGAMFQAIFMHPVMRMGWETMWTAYGKTKPTEWTRFMESVSEGTEDVASSAHNQLSSYSYSASDSIKILTENDLNTFIALFNTPVAQA